MKQGSTQGAMDKLRSKLQQSIEKTVREAVDKAISNTEVNINDVDVNAKINSTKLNSDFKRQIKNAVPDTVETELKVTPKADVSDIKNAIKQIDDEIDALYQKIHNNKKQLEYSPLGDTEQATRKLIAFNSSIDKVEKKIEELNKKLNSTRSKKVKIPIIDEIESQNKILEEKYIEFNNLVDHIKNLGKDLETINTTKSMKNDLQSRYSKSKEYGTSFDYYRQVINDAEKAIKDLHKQKNQLLKDLEELSVLNQDNSLGEQIGEEFSKAADKIEEASKRIKKSQDDIEKNIRNFTNRNKKNIDHVKSEQFMLANDTTGYALKGNNRVVGGVPDIVFDNTFSKIQNTVNSVFHSHPNELTAAFSFDDIRKAIEHKIKGLVHEYIISIEDVAFFDVEKFTNSQLHQIADYIENNAFTKLRGDFIAINDEDAFNKKVKNNVEDYINDTIDVFIQNLKENGVKGDFDVLKSKLLDSVAKTSLEVYQNFDDYQDKLSSALLKPIEHLDLKGDIDLAEDAINTVLSKSFQLYIEDFFKEAITNVAPGINIEDVYKKTELKNYFNGESLTPNINVDSVDKISQTIQKADTELEEFTEDWNELSQNVSKASDKISESMDEARKGVEFVNVAIDKLSETPLDDALAIRQYITDLEKIETTSKETQQAIQEGLRISAENEGAGSSLELLSNLQNEISENAERAKNAIKEVRTEQEKVNQVQAEKSLSFEDSLSKKQVDILDDYIDGLAKAQNRTEDLVNLTKRLQISNENREIESELNSIDALVDKQAKMQAHSEENKQSIIEMTEALRKSNEEREKQTVLDSELQNFAKLGQMVDEVRQAVEKKTEAFKEEANVVNSSVKSEVHSLEILIDELNQIAKKIVEIQQIFSSLDLNKVTDLSWIKEIKKLKSDDLTKASDALKSMFEAVKGLDIGDSNFLASINSILNKGKELQDFAKIVTSSQEAINAVKANTVEKETTEELLKQKQLQEELLYLDQQQADYERLRKQYEEEGVRQQQEVINAQKKADNEALIQAYKEADEYLAREKAYIEERNRALAEGAKQAKEYANSLKEAEKAEKKSNENYNKTLEQLQNKLNTISSKKLNQAGLNLIDEYQSKLNTLKTDYSEKELQELEAQIKQTFDGTALKNFQLASDNTVSQLRRQMQEFLSSNTNLGPEFKARGESIITQLSAEPTIAEANKLKAAIADIRAEAARANQTGKSFLDTIRERLTGVNAQLIAQYLSWQDLIRYARTAFDTIRELDYALVDLAKTTTMSQSEMNNFYLGANDVAKQMGVTTKEIIEQAASWSRLGYSSKEAATEMAALSSQFAAISPGMSIENATDGLVSTMKAFHIEVNDAERDIMDNVNRIGNTMATSNDEIVEMLKRSSAAMQAANNTIEETIALESAAVQITRNAETTGTAFRTEFVLVYSNMHYAYI